MASGSPRLPAVPPDGPPQRRSRASGAYLNRPLWQRYAISLLVAAVLLAGMVIWVAGHNTDSGPVNNNPAASVRANHEAEILVAQDQAPRVASVSRGLSPGTAVERVIHARMAAQVRGGAIAGPLKRADCRPTGARKAGTVGFSCTINAGSVNYPFLAAVDTAARRVTYCKRDPPPVPSENVPVSSRCRA
jgi:hypothetical protein